ncbi:hypothetical protein S40285_07737 [Stachybotrys chlorohalonatus IBT 40285]|uniref:Reticulon-like protein n=1 Tax=Stachybotrys chlorohalonatus (strain IBT 40285) TaxID=1283841 RepID=A0A084Q8E6_STAC4|nr:hypothetical protein S40285_07737 [Stachybotrys chlorohalonata IBT 40285]
MADAATTNGGSLLETTKANAAAAYNSVTSGPVAQNVQAETTKTSNEFNNLYASRKTPANPAATGQNLTHYHSLFFELLSWNNPRATGLAYGSIVALIFATRYLDIIGWALRLSYLTLGVTVAAEIAGKLVLNQGLTSQVRPRQYYLVPRETLDTVIGDVHELVNFFVIEAQRILFAENVTASAVTAVAAFLSYHLVSIVPYWGLALIAATMVFFVPLVYTSNQEIIDQQLKNASDVINAQTAQVRSVAQQQATNISSITQQYAGDYTKKAQEMLRGRSVSPSATAKPAPAPAKQPEFPTPPTEEPKATDIPAPDVPEEPVVAQNNPALAS